MAEKRFARHAAVTGSRWGRVVSALGLGVVCGWLFIAPAHAQLFGDNEARKAILDVRNRLNALEQELKRKDEELATRLQRVEPAQRSQLEIATQIDQLKIDLAKLRGQIDQLAYDLANEQKRTRDLYTDLDARLKKFEPLDVTVDGQTATVERTEQTTYEDALTLFRDGDFKGAAQSLKAFVQRYPNSAYVATAQYWLGNAYYQLKDYKLAVTAHRVVVDQHARSPRAPDALLNIAASLLELNDRKGARATLERIAKEYPDSESARTAEARLKSLTQ